MERTELRTTAVLARLDPEPEELERLETEISRMLSYFELMQRFDDSSPEPGPRADAERAVSGRSANRLRTDTPGMIEDAPDADGLPAAGVRAPDDRPGDSPAGGPQTGVSGELNGAGSDGPAPESSDRGAAGRSRARPAASAGALLELAPELESGHIVIPNVL